MVIQIIRSIILIEMNEHLTFLWVGHEEIVGLLIQNGANVNQMINGETALHAVANAGIDRWK